MRSFSRVLLAAALCAAPVVADAQRPAPYVRTLAGITASHLDLAGAATDPLYGFSLGVQGVMPVSERFAVLPEFLLVEKGGLEIVNGQRVGVDVRSFDLSILTQWNFEARGRVRPHVVLGPTYGYLLSCVAGADAPGRVLIGECTRAIHRTDAGITGGAGLTFDGRGIDWGVELRYQHGLADVSKGPNEVRTRTVQLLFSYRP